MSESPEMAELTEKDADSYLDAFAKATDATARARLDARPQFAATRRKLRAIGFALLAASAAPEKLDAAEKKLGGAMEVAAASLAKERPDSKLAKGAATLAAALRAHAGAAEKLRRARGDATARKAATDEFTATHAKLMEADLAFVALKRELVEKPAALGGYEGARFAYNDLLAILRERAAPGEWSAAETAIVKARLAKVRKLIVADLDPQVVPLLDGQ